MPALKEHANHIEHQTTGETDTGCPLVNPRTKLARCRHGLFADLETSLWLTRKFYYHVKSGYHHDDQINNVEASERKKQWYEIPGCMLLLYQKSIHRRYPVSATNSTTVITSEDVPCFKELKSITTNAVAMPNFEKKVPQSHLRFSTESDIIPSFQNPRYPQ